uniref:Peptidase M15A C-terminal domain-containing protein n=1 Tax=candidate division WOR-3 bacterium TaxID=2052148 RepID=A0A7C3YTA0_UNCW3
MSINLLLFLFAFRLLIGGLEYSWDIIGRFLLPEEKMPIKIITEKGGAHYGWIMSDGELQDISPEEKIYIAPSIPGFYTLMISDGKEKKRINIFVMHPFSCLKNRRINGFLIGRYPSSSPHPNLKGVKGFIELKKEWEDIFISPNYRIREFVGSAGGRNSSLPYLALREELVYKLELLNEKVSSRFGATKLKIVSGFRTPARNYNAGGGRNSAHIYGGAADVLLDTDGDGEIDDLNHDGRRNSKDSKILASLVEELDEELEKEYPQLVGGLGWYRRRGFIHVDVRGKRDRWRR